MKWVRTRTGLNSMRPDGLPHASREHPHGKLSLSTWHCMPDWAQEQDSGSQYPY